MPSKWERKKYSDFTEEFRQEVVNPYIVEDYAIEEMQNALGCNFLPSQRATPFLVLHTEQKW